MAATSRTEPTATAGIAARRATPDPHFCAPQAPSQTHRPLFARLFPVSPDDERPRVVGVDRDVRVAARRREDLVQQAGREARRCPGELDDRQAERQAHQVDRRDPDEAGRDDPDGSPGPALPGAQAIQQARLGSGAPTGLVVGRFGSRRDPVGGHRARRMVTTARIGMRMPSWGLMSAAMTVKIAARSGRSRQTSRRPSSRKTTPTESTWPQTTLSNQVTGLSTATRAAPSASDRRPPSSRIIDQTSQPIARSARIAGTLIRRSVDAAADGLADDPDQPQDVEVAGRVVVEEVAVVEAAQAVLGEVVRPELERAQVDPETGAWEHLCDDESKGETEREDQQDRADGSLRPGRPRRRSCASLDPFGGGASHRETAPARAWKVDRSVAQGRPADPTPAPRPSAAPEPHARRSPSGGADRWSPSAVYLATRTERFYDHFVWQAAAFLEGQAAIRYPVFGSTGRSGTPTSRTSCRSSTTDGVLRGLLPFPPLPAVLLLPFVAVFGLATDDHLLFTVLAADRCRPLLVDARPARGAARDPAGDDALLRVRDRLLVLRPARDDLVPGPHRGDRARCCWRAASRCAPTRPPRRDASLASAAAERRPRSRPRPRRTPVSLGRSPPVRRRPAVRAGLHRPPDDRLRGAVLPARRGGRGAWRRGWSAGLGAAIPLVLLVGLQPRVDRPRRPARLRLPVPDRGRRLPDPRLPRRTGPSRIRATSPRISASCCSPRRTSCRPTCPTPSA